jgi:hypothetical protein
MKVYAVTVKSRFDEYLYPVGERNGETAAFLTREAAQEEADFLWEHDKKYFVARHAKPVVRCISAPKKLFQDLHLGIIRVNLKI